MYRHLERARYLAIAASSRNTKPSELANLGLTESRRAMSGGEWRRLQKLGDVEPFEF